MVEKTAANAEQFIIMHNEYRREMARPFRGRCEVRSKEYNYFLIIVDPEGNRFAFPDGTCAVDGELLFVR